MYAIAAAKIVVAYVFFSISMNKNRNYEKYDVN